MTSDENPLRLVFISPFLFSQARGIEWVTALSALLALFGAALALRLRREEPAALQPSRG